MEQLSWKYKSLQRVEIDNTIIELFEWSSKAYVRVYGTGQNFVDIIETINAEEAKHVYEKTIKFLEDVAKNEV